MSGSNLYDVLIQQTLVSPVTAIIVIIVVVIGIKIGFVKLTHICICSIYILITMLTSENILVTPWLILVTMK